MKMQMIDNHNVLSNLKGLKGVWGDLHLQLEKIILNHNNFRMKDKMNKDPIENNLKITLSELLKCRLLDQPEILLKMHNQLITSTMKIHKKQNFKESYHQEVEILTSKIKVDKINRLVKITKLPIVTVKIVINNFQSLNSGMNMPYLKKAIKNQFSSYMLRKKLISTTRKA